MTKTGIEYLKFYNRIGGRINKKGNFVPFKKIEKNLSNPSNMSINRCVERGVSVKG